MLQEIQKTHKIKLPHASEKPAEPIQLQPGKKLKVRWVLACVCVHVSCLQSGWVYGVHVLVKAAPNVIANPVPLPAACSNPGADDEAGEAKVLDGLPEQQAALRKRIRQERAEKALAAAEGGKGSRGGGKGKGRGRGRGRGRAMVPTNGDQEGGGKAMEDQGAPVKEPKQQKRKVPDKAEAKDQVAHPAPKRAQRRKVEAKVEAENGQGAPVKKPEQAAAAPACAQKKVQEKVAGEKKENEAGEKEKEAGQKKETGEKKNGKERAFLTPFKTPNVKVRNPRATPGKRRQKREEKAKAALLKLKRQKELFGGALKDLPGPVDESKMIFG